jgi:hypothetical protein
MERSGLSRKSGAENSKRIECGSAEGSVRRARARGADLRAGAGGPPGAGAGDDLGGGGVVDLPRRGWGSVASPLSQTLTSFTPDSRRASAPLFTTRIGAPKWRMRERPTCTSAFDMPRKDLRSQCCFGLRKGGAHLQRPQPPVRRY